ncbi:MAG: hypothetical protein K5985_10960 [Lachnospiraceae bacterium]|nr:hypothetical protein [Lachnospiraceae bacterium]
MKTRKHLKKLTAVLLTLTMLAAMSVPALADTEKVFVSFVYGGNTSGQWIDKGSSVTPPVVTVIPGLTFVGWDHPLTNVQSDTQFTAIYKPTAWGDAALAAEKAKLPAPAISETTVADPNSAVNAGTTSAMNAAQQQALLAMLLGVKVPAASGNAGKAATPTAVTTPAATNNAAAVANATATAAAALNAAAAKNAAQAQTPAATTPAQTPAPAATTPAATTPAPAAVGPTVSFTDKNGNTGTFTQKEWQTLLNVYGQNEEVLRKHTLGDLQKIAAYYSN